MNDPNGPIFYGGYYHMFYQHNPYGDKWGHMHWGHARSKDLVQWEHLPIALWPSKSRGEEHCFSGCAALSAKGEPMIFYTSIGHPKPECWIAMPEDKDLLRWKKFDANPVLTEASPGIPYYDFRDPFVFSHHGKTYMVHGGNLNKAKGGQAIVSLYEAQNPELTQWKYKSILFQHPDPKVVNIECPNFFSLGEKFVLITSPHRACDYFIGTFDPEAGKFNVESSGMLDHSSQFYAPNCLLDGQGRRILWGWIRGFKEGKGWNGCLGVPRILSIEEGRLIQTPAPELAKLRVREVDSGFGGNQFEFEGVFNLERQLPSWLKFSDSELEIFGKKINVRDPKKIQLHVFRDRSLAEVFVDGGRESVTHVADIEFPGPEFAAECKGWELKSIWQ